MGPRAPPRWVLVFGSCARANGRSGRPRNPAHLAKPGELLEAVRGDLRVLAYEHLTDQTPKPAARQRLCAVNEAGGER